MGGRGRQERQAAQSDLRFTTELAQREYIHSDHWAWVGQLSPERLDNYGHAMARREQEGVLEFSQDAFLRELRKEHFHRSGEVPVWGNPEKAQPGIDRFIKFTASRSSISALSALAPVASDKGHDRFLSFQAPVASSPAEPLSDDVAARVARAAKAVRAASNSRVSRAVEAARQATQEQSAPPQSSAADVDRARKDARNARDRARRAARRAERERDQ